jgi:glycosyltransferase involved in cell wall biosynthesis
MYVSASHIENSPNSVAEAQLLGMPVIATDVGGTSTYIENKKSGLLIPSGDPYALAGMIKSLSMDQALQKTIARNARKEALERHNKDRIVKCLLEAYASILNRSNA